MHCKAMRALMRASLEAPRQAIHAPYQPPTTGSDKCESLRQAARLPVSGRLPLRWAS